MQRTRQAPGREAPVELVGLLQGVRVGEHDRVDRRLILVVARDALEVGVHQLVTGELVGFHRGVYLRDGCLFDSEWRGLGRQ